MTDTVTVLSELDAIGRQLADALLVPSIEAFILGIVVWAGLRVDKNASPRIRHLLWLLVIVKPMFSVVFPWQGPFPLPALLSRDAGTIHALQSHTTIPAYAWQDHIYGIAAVSWLMIAVAIAIWRILGYGLVAQRVRQTMPVEVPWVSALFEKCRSISGITQHVEVRMSDDFSGPTLITVGRPVVVIPSWCLIELSPQEMKQVFLHELMHYSRRDHLSLALVHIAKCFFFFNPLIWYVGRMIDREAERACDMAVVHVANRPTSYASSLLKVAEGPISRGWHGVLELARSASLTAVRITEVLTGFGGNGYRLSHKGILVIAFCGFASVMPFFHVPVLDFVTRAVELVELSPVSPRPSDLAEVAVVPQSPVQVSPSFVVGPDVLDIEPIGGISGAVSAMAGEAPSKLNNARPVARSTMASLMVSKNPDRAMGRSEWDSRQMRASLLGVASEKPAGKNPASAQLTSGQFEIQGYGQNTTGLGAPREMSVRAGYFVTKEHEFGGVLSLVSPTGVEERKQEKATGDGGFQGRVSAKRTVLPRRIPGSLSQETSGSDANEEEDDPAIERLRLGAFYRYNLTQLSDVVVPFVGLGTGIELRDGRNPVLIDGGGGVRCFLTSKSALVVQVDYTKDVVFSTRARVSTSLGFSTIF